MSDSARPPSLESLIIRAGGPVQMLRQSQLGTPVPFIFPGIPNEFTNWRDEVRAWRESVALLEQSYHMEEIHLRGTQVLPFLRELAINKLDPFPPLRGKHLVVAAQDGNVIGDTVLIRESEEFFRVVGVAPAGNWLMFNAERTSYDVTAERHPNWAVKQGPRDVFRIEILGPRALDLVGEVASGTLPEIKFFHVGEFKIAGKSVRALRHGMAGTPGFEIYGAWNDQQAVRDALETAGEKYGMRKVGALAYSTTAQESGWMPGPPPAIYTGKAYQTYREWLTVNDFEAIACLAGSFVSADIKDYYVDPIEVGYGPFIDWNRDFVGRDALRVNAKDQRRTKVTLEWNDADVAATIASSLFGSEQAARYLALPTAIYGSFQADAVRKNGRTVGVSQWVSYSANARHVISSALVSLEHAKPGTELTVLWGEIDSRRAVVDKNTLREIRATVAPSPYFEKIVKTGRQ